MLMVVMILPSFLPVLTAHTAPCCLLLVREVLVVVMVGVMCFGQFDEEGAMKLR